MDPSQNLKSYLENVQAGLITTTKSINRLASEDLTFHRTVNPDIGEQLSEQSARLLDLSNRLLRAAAKTCNVRAPPPLEDVEDLELNWRGVVDVVDSVLEKVDTTLDEYKGLVKRKDPPVQDAAPAPKKPKPLMLDRNIRNANVTKPQLSFERPVQNFPDSPWRPILTSKPHATVPFAETLIRFEPDDVTSQYKHPYEPEIVAAEYPASVYERRDPIKYQPTETTSATWVDTFDGVLDMLEELKRADEIAVDLEHHDYRTYFGLVCLMQISTREKDWIVDTLKPWRHKLEVLNEVFANPKIVKVLHGSYMDVIWLQRDLGLYLNGLFDTFFACDILYQSRSLAFLLKKFVDFDADKKYQMADWRIRPLPEEMADYARSDTHYLLYIYDQIRNELVEKSDRGSPDKDYIETVVQKSKAQALDRYEHLKCEVNGEGQKGWRSMVLKNRWAVSGPKAATSGPQFAVFRAVWKWRDHVARTEDESTVFVLPQHAVLDIAVILPPDAKALHSLIPYNCFLAKQALSQLWQLVQEARDRGESEASLNHYLLTGSLKIGPARGASMAAKVPAVPVDASIRVEKLDKSRLFGDMPLSSVWDENRQPGLAWPEYIKLPWQKFVEEQQMAMMDVVEPIDTNVHGNPSETPHESYAMDVDSTGADAITTRAVASNDEFIIKPGAGRKRAAADNDPVTSSDSEAQGGAAVTAVPLLSTDDIRPGAAPPATTDQGAEANKKSLKRARKAQKAAEKRALRAAKRLVKTKSRKAAKQAENAAKNATKQGKVGAVEASTGGSGDGGGSVMPDKMAEEEAEEEEEEEEEEDDDDDDDDEPFNYANATSVLHAPTIKPNGNDSSATTTGVVPGSAGNASKIFNPYGDGGTDEIKGARRAPPIQGSRTATFRK